MSERAKRGILTIILGLVLSVSIASAQHTASEYVAVGDSALAQLNGMDALKAYQSALELDSNNVTLLQKTISLIKDLLESKDIVYGVGRSYGEIAETYLNRLIKIDSSDKGTLLARAQVAEIDYIGVHSHDPKKVTKRYAAIRSCLAGVSESAECSGMLGRWYLEQTHGNTELRIRSINRLLEDTTITPADSSVLVQISWDSTMKYLELAHKLAPDHMGHAFFLAEIYFARGDTAQATDLFKKVDAMPIRHFRDPQYKRSLANYKARLKIKN